MWGIGEAPPRSPGARRAANGFTLIEALVVVAVAALVAGLLFPSVQRSLSFWEYRSALAAVNAALARCRAEAIRQDRTTQFAIAPGGDGFAAGGAAPYRLPATIRLARAGQHPILFYRDGSASGGEVAVIAGRRRQIVTVAPATGLIGRRT